MVPPVPGVSPNTSTSSTVFIENCDINYEEENLARALQPPLSPTLGKVWLNGESLLNLLPNGRRRGQAPIPASVNWNTKPQWLPLGWRVNYRSQPGSNRNKMFIYMRQIMGLQVARNGGSSDKQTSPGAVLKRI